LRHIIERTIGLMDEGAAEPQKNYDNVYDFSAYRRVGEGGGAY